VEFRVEKTGIIHTTIGRRSFQAQGLKDNLLAVVETLIKLKPATVKGTYIKSVTLATTMSPGIRVDATDIELALKAK